MPSSCPNCGEPVALNFCPSCGQAAEDRRGPLRTQLAGFFSEFFSLDGRVRCRALVSRQVRRGVIWMPFHFPEARTNRLTTDAGDKITGTGEYKVCAARIEPIEGSVPEQVFPGAYAAAAS